MKENTTVEKRGSIDKRVRRTIIGTGFGISAVLLLLVIVQVVWLGYNIRDMIQGQADTSAKQAGEVLHALDEETAGNYASICEGYLNEHFEDDRRQVESVAAYMAMNPSPSQVRNMINNLPEYEEQNPGALSIYVVPERGRVISTNGQAADDMMDMTALHETRWYQKASVRNQPHWSNVVKGGLSDSEKVICSAPYNDRYGRFAGVVAASIEMSSISDILVEEDIKKESIALVLFDRKDRLMYATGSFEDVDYASSLLGEKDFAIDGDYSYTLRKMPESGWSLCVVQDRTEQEGMIRDVLSDLTGFIMQMHGSIRSRLLWGAARCVIFLLVGGLLMLRMAHSLSGSLTRPIVKMTEQVEKIGGGDLSQQVDVETDDEIGRLGEAFNKMTKELREHIDHISSINKEKERMVTERSLVRQLQWNMLPHVFPAFPDRKDFDVYASLIAADEGGGSFYDFFFIDARTFCIAVGEASGTGIPATLFAIVAKTNIKSYAQQGYGPDRILAETNNQLAYGNDEGTVAHVFVAIINLSSGETEYACAGEAPVQWKHSGEAPAPLPGDAGVTLGNMENVPYAKRRIRLSQGDLLFAHTRDTAECPDSHGNIYTTEYLYEKWGECSAKEYRLPQMVEALNDDIKAYTDGTQRSEDVTMLMFRYWG